MYAFIAKLKKPRISRRILFVAEILILIAVCLTILAVLKLHPIPLTLFLIIAQPFFIIGIVLYIIVVVVGFLSRHGTSQVDFAPGEVIFKKGDKGEFIYTIISGNVEIIEETPEEGEKVIAVLGQGDYFGEMALISDSPRSAMARAVNSVEAMTISRDDFKNLHYYSLLVNTIRNRGLSESSGCSLPLIANNSSPSIIEADLITIPSLSSLESLRHVNLC